MRIGRVIVLAIVLATAQLSALPVHARMGSCSGCATVADVEPIFYTREKAPDGATLGTIIGGVHPHHIGRPEPVAGVATNGLVGRKANGSEQGDDARGLRLELRMDSGGLRTVEIVEGMRVYRGDRFRVYRNRIESID